MVDISFVLEMVVAGSIVIGTLFAMIQLREMTRDRHTELMLRFSEAWLTLEFEDIISKLIRGKFSNGEEMEELCSTAGLQMIADFFEFMGGYTKKGLLKREEALDAYPAEWSWEKMKPWIIYTRSASGIGDLYSNFEWLATGEYKG